MTDDQLPQLISALKQLSDSMAHSQMTYTIAGAADYPILMVMGGILVAIIGFMWVDLRATIKDHRVEWESHLTRHCQDDKEAVNLLWAETRDIRGEIEKQTSKIEQAMKECQGKCCD